MGLRLSPEKTLVTHIDEGLDFLGWRIQRHRKKGEDRQYVYTYPAKKALRAICRKVKDVCRGTNIDQPLSALLHRLNRCCGAGVSTSGRECPARPSNICPGSYGGRCGRGCAGNTGKQAGRLSADGIATADGGLLRERPSYSIPGRLAPRDTGIEGWLSPLPGRSQYDNHRGKNNGACGEPVAQ